MSRPREPFGRAVMRPALKAAQEMVGPVERFGEGLNGWGVRTPGGDVTGLTYNEAENARARAVAACLLDSLGLDPARSRRLLASAKGHPEDMARAVIRCADA